MMQGENRQIMRYLELTLFILLAVGLTMLVTIKLLTGESFREAFATIMLVLLSLATGALGYRCLYASQRYTNEETSDIPVKR